MLNENVLKPVIYNLEEFAHAMVNFISNDATELVEVFKQAYAKYSEFSYFSWAFTYFTRDRHGAFEKTISDLETSSDPIMRMQEFKTFISEGEWKSTSANTRVLTYLIRAVPGYKNSEDDLTDEEIYVKLIPDLKILIERDLKSLLNEYHLMNQRTAERKQELDVIRASQQKGLENIVLLEDEVKADQFALSHPEKQIFHLACPSVQCSQWQLTWYDLSGKANALVIEPELAKTLKKLESTEILPEVRAKIEIKIKLACAKLVEEYLSKTQVLLDPPLENLINLTSAFVLKKQLGSYQLYWYDSLGQSYPLQLQEFSLLAHWLAEKKQLLAGDFPRLKTYLQHVRVRRQVDGVKQTNIGQILQKNHGITLVTHNNLAKIPRFRLIAGTYFLTREPEAFTGVWTLYQKKKTEANLQKVNTDSWDNFHEILTEHKNLSAEQLTTTVAEPYELCLKPENFVPEKNTLYISITKMGEKEEEVLQYSVINALGKQITDVISEKELKQKFQAPLTSEQLFSMQDNILAIAAKRGHIVSIADQIRDAIKKSVNNQYQNQLYLGINDFSPTPGGATSYKPSSFIVTKKENQWKLFYIDALQRVIAVDNAKVKGLSELFAQWNEEPNALSQAKLDQLAQLLNSYKPAKRIDLADFDKVAKCIEKLSGAPSSVSEVTQKTDSNEQTSSSAPVTGKLNLHKYAAAIRIFGAQPKTPQDPGSDILQWSMSSE